MSKITNRFIKFFLISVASTVLVCFVLSTLFFSKMYKHQQYSTLKHESDNILLAYENGYEYKSGAFRGVLVKKDTSIILWSTQKKGRGHMTRGHSGEICSNYSTLEDVGIFKGTDGVDYIYTKLPTKYGDLYVFKDKMFMDNYLKMVYMFMALIFLAGLIVSIPIAIFMGRKFTRPVLSLKRSAESIAAGDYSSSSSSELTYDDELRELSLSMDNMRVQLQKKDKLQKEFIANVSHDFKTPLSIIRSCSEAISDGLLDDTGNMDYAGRSIKQVDRLNTMVSDIMNLSKLQGLEAQLNRTWIGVDDFTSSIDKDIEVVLDKDSLDFSVSMDGASASSSIFADQALLRRCLLNFLTNSCRVSPHGGKIQLNVTTVQDSSDNTGCRLIFSIEDQGPGISSDILHNIWDRYTKASQSGGMGLGLAINKEILIKHEFGYSADNSKDGGALFSFWVPSKYLKS